MSVCPDCGRPIPLHWQWCVSLPNILALEAEADRRLRQALADLATPPGSKTEKPIVPRLGDLPIVGSKTDV